MKFFLSMPFVANHCLFPYLPEVIMCIKAWVDASYIGSKATRVLAPKVHINGKINIIMEKKTLKTNV
jgi:hypothetical protein